MRSRLRQPESKSSKFSRPPAVRNSSQVRKLETALSSTRLRKRRKTAPNRGDNRHKTKCATQPCATSWESFSKSGPVLIQGSRSNFIGNLAGGPRSAGAQVKPLQGRNMPISISIKRSLGLQASACHVSASSLFTLSLEGPPLHGISDEPNTQSILKPSPAEQV